MQQITPQMKESGAVEICKRLREVSGGRILDVGTQDGDCIGTLMKTLKHYESFTGIDISSEDLDKARESFKEDPVEFIQMNAEKMTFEDSTFDTVSMAFSIHHLEKPEQVLKEIKRVLKPDGNFLLQEMFWDGNQNEAKQTDILVHHWGAKVDSLRGVPHFETLSRKKIIELVKEEFTSIEVFESNRSVKCLFCDSQVKCGNPMNLIDSAIEEIDEILGQMKDHPQFDTLSQEAETLREMVRKTGSDPASFLFVLCKY